MPAPPLRTGGSVWGPERVRLGISLGRLSKLSGVDKAILSMAENGRLIPTSDEYQRVTTALRQVETGTEA
jgi:predicted transcriptional regulator